MPAANVVRRVSADAMIEAAVVPDHQVPLAPLVPVTKTRIVHQREKLVEDSVGSVRCRAVDTQREARRKIEGGASGLGMRAHNGLMGLRDHGRDACAFFPRRLVQCSGEAQN